MNEIRQQIANIFRLRKIKNCALAMGVAESTAYRYAQPTNRNGENIPLPNLIALNADVATNGGSEALQAAYTLSQEIVKPLGAVVVDRELLIACLNGIPLKALVTPKEITEICSKCEDPVRYLPVCSCRWR
jgi:hypothetical protein